VVTRGYVSALTRSTLKRVERAVPVDCGEANGRASRLTAVGGDDLANMAALARDP
jgi:hypothetical protein